MKAEATSLYMQDVYLLKQLQHERYTGLSMKDIQDYLEFESFEMLRTIDSDSADIIKNHRFLINACI